MERFRCILACGRGFGTETGLQIHRASCDIYQFEDNSIRGLSDRILAKKERKRALKRQRLEKASLPLVPEMTDPPPIEIPPDEPLPDSSTTAPQPLSEPSVNDIDPVSMGRGQRAKRPTWKVLERLPQPSSPLPSRRSAQVLSSQHRNSNPDGDPPPSLVSKIIQSTTNLFGIFREYTVYPSHDPEDTTSLDDLSNLPTNVKLTPPRSSPFSPLISESNSSITDSTDKPSFAPFANWSIWGIINWMWTGSKEKSHEEINRLVREVLLHPQFSTSDLENFNSTTETAKLDKENAFLSDGWKESNVSIAVPDGKLHQSSSDPPIPWFTVPGLQHRSLVEIIRTAWSDASARSFHFWPFKQFWQRAPNVIERLHGELFTSDAFLEAHEELQKSPREPNCTLERVVCSLMFWSDSTQLANFGNASLWPIYLFFGNQSKYIRCKPSSGACHHVAYIPKLPDTFHDFFVKLTGEAPSADTLTQCRRELMHSVWSTLLDADFIHAYVHGIVIRCADGVERRVYPRIFTYSADYPEKILLASIRNLGTCLCPRCKTKKTQVSDIGMKRDESRRVREARDSNDASYQVRTSSARKKIYEDGKGVKSTAVEGLLAEESLVPTSNAFLERLSPYGFNIFPMFVVDLLHEFELGVWKAFLTHLIRMLVAIGGNAIQDLNQRFRRVPVFGLSTIRKISANTSALRQLAARDYEDYLQCALPVFEGLFPDASHNKAVQDTLFALAEWHCLAKLRLHTDSTVSLLREGTKILGTRLRFFVRHVCPEYDTRELPREEAARIRRRKKKAQALSTSPSNVSEPAAATGAKKKILNLSTYKLHALGDYVPSILLYGTTDSYSTQSGELEHRRVKRFYARTNKNHYVRQITRLERRERALERRRKSFTASPRRLTKRKRLGKGRGALENIGFHETEYLGDTPPDAHHHISSSRNFPIPLHDFTDHITDSESEGSEHDQGVEQDPSAKNFVPKLLDHLLARIRAPGIATTDEEFSWYERQQVVIQHDRIFRHKVFRVNYTSYDVRRCQDTMNPRTQANVMLPALDLDPETGTSLTGHPFRYARILGVFHADVVHTEPGHRPKPMRMEFLWVQWYKIDKSYRGGLKSRRLHRLELLPEHDPASFGFVDPDDVIRGSHIIPAFAWGTAPSSTDENIIWKYYYVNFFVDRDMYMRYQGGGVGHAFIPFVNNEPTADPNEDPMPQELEEDAEALAEGENVADGIDGETDDEDVDDEGEEPEDGDEGGNESDEENLDPEDGEGNHISAEDEEGGAEL